MPDRSETVLRVVYALLAVDALLKSILLVFGGKWALMLAFPGIPSSEISKLLLLTRQESGALEFGVGVILFLSMRNPRNSLPVLYGIAATLFIGAVLQLVGTYRLGLVPFFSAYAMWLHSAIRIPWLAYFSMSALQKQLARAHRERSRVGGGAFAR